MFAVNEKIKINGYKKIFTVKSINNDIIQVEEMSGVSFHQRICSPANLEPSFVKGKHHVVLIGEQEDEGYDEIIHNYFEVCPNCQTEFAGTNAYEDLRERKPTDIDIQCNHCGCIFEKVSGEWYSGLIVQAKST